MRSGDGAALQSMRQDSAARSAPRITMVTPSLNQGAYLERAMQSVLSQRYPNLEYLVMDGGSTDQSLAIIGRHAHELAHWEHQPDRGVGHALNKGFARATGEIFGWLNADDVLLPGALHIVGQIFSDYPAILWLTSGSLNLSADDRFFVMQTSRKWFSPWTQLFRRSLPPQHCTFWRKALWDRAGGSVIEDSRFMDCELWLRFYEHAPLYVADTVFGAWRLHPASYSAQRMAAFHRHLDEAQRPYLRRHLQRHRRLAPLLPAIRFYFRYLDRDLLNRVGFELWRRRTRFLTFDLPTDRFRLRPGGGLLPRPWTFTIASGDGRAAHEERVGLVEK